MQLLTPSVFARIRQKGCSALPLRRSEALAKTEAGKSHMQGRATASQSTLPEPRPLDIRIVMAGLAFILRVLPLVFEGPTPAFCPLQSIEFIGYSACLICGVAPRSTLS